MADPCQPNESVAMRRSPRCFSGQRSIPDSSSSRRSPSCTLASPSRSRSASGDHSNSGDSSGQHQSHHSGDSQSKSGTSIPDVVYEHDFNGISVVRIKKCAHGRHAVLKKCWGGKNTGRQFLACPIQDELQQCQFLEWLDEPWPERVQQSLEDMWKELKTTRRCEARANEALHEALVCNETANNARVALLEEVNRTKRLAEKICRTYKKKAAYAVVDKCKVMYILYCLLGVLVFLVVAIFFRMK